MDYKFYERKLNDVILKCPIEAGVEILVYMLLDSLIDSENISLIDINRLHKKSDLRLSTDGGVSDIAVVSRDFRYNSKEGKVYGFVEVKANSQLLEETGQTDGQKSKCLDYKDSNEYRHYLYTNGLTWKYYLLGECKWKIVLANYEKKPCEAISVFEKISIDKKKFEELKTILKEIKWVD